MGRFLPRIIIYSLSLLLGGFFALQSSSIQAATATHIVISEIQTAAIGSTSADFIELYNPTSLAVNLNPFRLVKHTGSASDSGIISFTAADIIPAHGYFLWCNNVIAGSLGCDVSNTNNIANNNSIGLRNGALNTGILVDALTIGVVANPLGEGTPLASLSAGTSAERKARDTSTNISMGIGGSDEFMGNGEDSDNNFSDFVLRVVPQPQSSISATEELVLPTDTPTQTPTPTLEPTSTPTPTLTPTATPTDTPIPTNTPTPTPTNTPTPTLEPTSTATPTPTLTISPTITSTATPTLSPTPSNIPSFQLVCLTRFIDIHVLNLFFHIPYPVCSLVKRS